MHIFGVMYNDSVSFIRSKLGDHHCIRLRGSWGRVVLDKCLWDGVLVVVMIVVRELAFWR